MSDIEEMAISKFKATCLAVLERVRRTGQPVRITRFGKPVAEVRPPQPVEPKQRKLGTLAGEIEIVGDIVGPLYSKEERDKMEAEWLRKWDELLADKAPRAGRHPRKATPRKLQRP